MTDSGLVVVDKPAGLTSHTVVARIRRLAGTRKVGHAGTLDPSATGVLLVGVERATRLLGYLARTDKSYEATIRLGQSTSTDDADSPVVGGSSTELTTDAAIRENVAALTGPIRQVPSSVSAIKVDGQRAYARVRAGEEVRLDARDVVVSSFDVLEIDRPEPDLIDLRVVVACSTGTYVRALARDLGSALGVGGHLTALRRTRVGGFAQAEARTLEQLEQHFAMLSLSELVRRSFPKIVLEPESASAIRHGRRTGVPVDVQSVTGPIGAFDRDGNVLALMEVVDAVLRPLVVLAPASAL